MTQKAWIVLGDVVDSRKIADRAGFERKVDQTISRINDDFESGMVAEFERLKRIDEIGGVLKSAKPIVDIQRILSLGLHPHEIRVVAVRGEIETSNTGNVSEMDGYGFAEAADELERLESTGGTFSLVGISEKDDNLITAGINMVELVRNSWTERRVEVLDLYEKYESQQAVADELGVTRQTIHSHISDKSIKRVEHAESMIADEVRSLSFEPLEDFN